MSLDKSKELPRIPAVKTFSDFRAFSQAGRDLAHWHLNYETVECFPGVAVAVVRRRDLTVPLFPQKNRTSTAKRRMRQQGRISQQKMGQ